MTLYPQARRNSRLKAFKSDGAAFSAGQFLRATILDDRKAENWCHSHGIPIEKAQSEGVNSAGGFLVPTEFEQAIIDLRDANGTFRQEVQVVPMGTATMTIPRRAGGLQAFFIEEGQAIPESQKTWDQVSLTAKKIAVLTRISSELSEDAIINAADDLAQEMAFAFAAYEDRVGWHGDGTFADAGITGVATKFGNGLGTMVPAATGHDLFSELSLADITKLIASVPKYAEKNAKFYCSQFAWMTVFQRLIASAGGNNINTLTGGKARRSFLGYPVVIDLQLPDSPISLVDEAMLYFGDLSMAARMGERRGITIAASRDAFFVQDQTALRATQRFDVNVHDLSPMAALVGA
jgi:HK97 family phage major capsid protein